MARALFIVCTRKRTLQRLKLLLPSSNHFTDASYSQFHNLHAPIRPFSTHFVNPRFPASFIQSWNLSGGRSLPTRPFWAASGDDGAEKDTAAAGITEPDYEFDVDFGKSVSFGIGNEVNDGGCDLSDNVVVESDDSNECNSKVVDDTVERTSSDELENSKNREDFVHVASRDPVELHRALCSAKKGAKLERSEVEMLMAVFRYFAKSGWASNQALAIYIGLSFFPTAVHKFQNFFRKKCPPDIARYLVSLGPCDAAIKFLFPIFVEFCLDNFPNEIKRFRGMVESANLMSPHTWFPFAWAMKRKIIYHCGPTNSGKTYNALQRFMEAKKGIYCSPLRLLAMEVFDKVNANGVYCSLLTGQEKKHVPFSNHVACTVEMVSKQELYDVAIIDEIQMMADPYRGYAWTRALLGLKADEIHLCGDPSVLDIVRKICQDTGDDLYEQHYGRFKPLVVEAKTLLGNLQNIRSGDCVVAFSRREIF